MSISTQIQQTIDTFREILPQEVNAMIEQGAGEISAMPIAENALKVGATAPNFELKDYKGNTRSLSEYLADGPVVVTFYRGLWCPYCNIQLQTYNARLDEIKQAGANLVAIAAEGPEGYDIVQQSNMPDMAKDAALKEPGFDVLHDAEGKAAQGFGLEFVLPESHKGLLDMMGVDIEKATGNDRYTFADPATFIIGTDGVVKWAFIPNNYRKRAEVDDILANL